MSRRSVIFILSGTYSNLCHVSCHAGLRQI